MKNNQYTATPNWFDKVQQTDDSVSTGNTYVTNFGSIQQQSGLTDLVIEITGEEDGNGLSPEVSWNKEESKLSFVKTKFLKEGVGGGLTSAIITGTGNAVTDASLEDEGKTLNLKKDKTFLIPNDLLGYAKEDWVTNQLQNYVTLNTEQDITAIKNFLEGITIGSSKKKFYEKDGVVYIDANLAVTGGITQYAVDPANVSDLMDNIRTDGTTIRVNPDTKELEVIGGIGIDLSAMWDALSASTSEQINRSHLTTALQGYATESWANSNFPTKTGGGASGTWGIDISGTAANANKLGNTPLTNNKQWWGSVPFVNTDGTFEIGKYIDFHNTNGESNDYSTRLQCSGAHVNIVNLPSENGTLALLSDNVASATKLQTPRTIWGKNFDGTANISGELSSVTGIRFSSGERFDTNGNIILPSSTDTHNWNVFNSLGNAALKVYANGITDMYIAKIGEYLLYQNEATLKIYSDYNPSSPTEYGKETACIQTSFDGQDPTTSTYPRLYPGRCVLALQPRGGWVGIGTENPSYLLDVNGDIQANGWVRTKGNAGWCSQTWGGGWYMQDSGWIRAYGNKNILTDGSIQTSRYVVKNNSTSYFSAFESVNNAITGRDPDYKWIWYHAKGGDVQRGFTLWSYAYGGAANQVASFVAYGGNLFKVFGNILATGGITQYSDQRAKTIIEQITLSLKDIAQSPAIRFKWNGWKQQDDGKTHIGGIAQYVQTILPEVIYNTDNVLTMDYATTGYIFAVNTAKHLLNYETKTDKEINKLKKRIKYLEKQLKKLGYEEANIMDN